MGCVVCLVPPGFYTSKCGIAQSTTATLPLLVCQPLPRCKSYLPRLPISAPPTSLDESLFFNSLVVILSCSLIFWQFWLFFFLNCLLSFWFCKEVNPIYQCFHLGQKLLFLKVSLKLWVSLFLYPYVLYSGPNEKSAVEKRSRDHVGEAGSSVGPISWEQVCVSQRATVEHFSICNLEKTQAHWRWL